MKKILLVLFVLFLSLNISAQNKPKYVYCQIVGTAKFMSKKVTIQIDYGQSLNLFADNRLREESTGKVKVFNSMIDALNYMGKSGWEFTQAYVITTNNQSVYYYLMKKPFTEFDKESQIEFMDN